MKHVLKLGGLIGWLVVGVGLAAAQTAAQAPAGPRITLSQDSWDFGEVWHPQSVSLTLIVKNTGDAPLQISDVRATCGCTLVEPGRKTVPPGETTEVKVRYNSEGKQGHQESKVIIDSNDAQRPTVEMKISGEVKRAVNRTPIGGLVIRTLDTKPGLIGTVRLENQMPEPMKLRLSGSSLQDWLDVEIKELTPGQVCEVVGRTKKDVPPTGLRGTLVFDTGLSQEAKVSIHARVQVLSRVEIVPPVIFLDPKRDNKPSERWVSLQYYGPGDFSVTQGESKTPGIQVKLRPTETPSGGLENLVPKMTALVRTTVSLPPASAIPPEGAIVEYTTSDPLFPKVRVEVTTDLRVWQDKVHGPPEPPVKPL
jgi:hypothetical protein